MDLATVMHEMFMSLVFAGFSDEQAMRLTVLWVVESARGQQFPRPT